MPQDKKNPFEELRNPQPKGTITTRPVQQETRSNPFEQLRQTNPQVSYFKKPTIVEEPGTLGQVVSTIAPVIDVLSRGQYASAKFFDGLADESKGFFEVISEAANEIIDPKYRLSFSDVIKKNAPVWAQDNPTATTVLGFLGDVALDPTTYLGVGLGKSGLKVGGQVLTKTGKKFLEQQIERETVNMGANLITLAQSQYGGAALKQLSKKVLNEEVRKTAEQNILNAVSSGTAKDIFEKSQLQFTFAGKPIIKTKDTLNAVGLGGLYDTISNNLKSISSSVKASAIGQKAVGLSDAVKGTFNRNYQLPDEYVKLRTELENQFDFVADDVIRDTQSIFKKIPQDRREVIGRAMSLVDDNTKEAEQLLGRSVTQQEANRIMQAGLQQARLNPDEMATVAKLYQGYKNAGELEVRAGMLKVMMENYSPRKYKELGNPGVIPEYVLAKAKLSKNLSSSKAREFLTLQEAEAYGYVPELDAAMLYASRMLDSRRKLAVKQFEEGVNAMFGTKGFYDAKLPPRIMNDIRMLGDPVYPVGLNTDSKYWLEAYDKLTSWFKRGATTLKPSFASKQLVSNTFQSMMITGLKAFKAFDPRSAIDAGLLLLDRGKPTKGLPDYLNNLISKYSNQSGADAILAQRTALSKISGEERLKDYAKDYKLTSTFGQQYTGEELVDLARQNGVIRGFDVTGEKFQRSLAKELAYDPDNVKQVAGRLGAWWNHAAIAEDYGRMTLFINGIRMGYSAEEASKLVNKALFDYSRGLSSVEKNVIKRIVPFYTFQRFAIPFVLKQSAQKAGIPVTADKTIKLFDKLLNSGETLTPAEQNLFGDSFLIEQPRLFRGFDKDGKATFNVLNNLTPIDTLSFLSYDRYGNLDYQRTAEKSILGAITPFIKLPLEQVLDKNFFTGQTIENAGKLGNLSNSTIGSVLPNFVKEAIGWENRVNAKTGKVTTYVNPFLAHTVQGFVPAVRTFIRPIDKDITPLEAAMDMIAGVPTVKLDFKEQATFQDLKNRKDIREIQSRLRTAKLKGSTDNFEKAMEDYQQLIQAIGQSRKARNESIVRGQGSGTTNPTSEFK